MQASACRLAPRPQSFETRICDALLEGLARPSLLAHALRREIAANGWTADDFDLVDAHYFYPDGVAAAQVAESLADGGRIDPRRHAVGQAEGREQGRDLVVQPPAVATPSQAPLATAPPTVDQTAHTSRALAAHAPYAHRLICTNWAFNVFL